MVVPLKAMCDHHIHFQRGSKMTEKHRFITGGMGMATGAMLWL
jgi:hypothetical protein